MQRKIRRPWHRQGWVWLIAAGVAVLVLYLGLTGIAGALEEQTEAIQRQTQVLQEQNHILDRIEAALRDVGVAVQHGLERLADWLSVLASRFSAGG